jgi:hypothetical protein
LNFIDSAVMTGKMAVNSDIQDLFFIVSLITAALWHSKPATTKLVHILCIEALKVIYFAPIHSLIKYGIILWGNSTTMHKVFMVQKRY